MSTPDATPCAQPGAGKQQKIVNIMKPLIITTGAHIFTEEGHMQNLLWQVYADGILIGGGLPLFATDVSAADAVQLADQSDGLFLSGGFDVSPACYGEEPLDGCGSTDEKRDALEFALLDAFVQKQKPILGICRGCQMINVYFGGTLWQDIPSQTGYVHPYDSIHDVRVAPGSIYEQLFGPIFTVNSLHHQAVKDLGRDLVADAWAENGPFVEAYHHRTLPIVCTQWHPERMAGNLRMTSAGPQMAPFFRYFISLCEQRRVSAAGGR